MRPLQRVLLLALLGCALAPPALADDPTVGVREALRARLAASGGTVLVGDRERVVHPKLRPFYAARDFEPAWGERAAALVPLLHASADDGLDPADYDPAAIEALLARGTLGAEAAADLDLLSTDAFLALAEHLLRGRVDPATLTEDWHPHRRERDLAAVLDRALESGDLAGALDGLRPPHPEYAALRDALARYRHLEGTDLPTILPAGPIAPGARSTRVPLVRERLRLFGDYAGPDPADSLAHLLDVELAEAVRRFQARYGFEPTGTVDDATRHALNGSAAGAVEALVLNLERWRWLPDTLGQTHLLVNLPAFRLMVREDGEVALAMRAVVGKRSWMTPVFSAPLSTVVFNPTWGVPPSIASVETIPRARSRGAGYLTGGGYNVYRRSDGERVDPATVDWSAAGAGDYRFVQSPGRANPLGEVKFQFPNPHGIYLHDTNQKRLFGRDRRAYSHGCIRLAEPIRLAEHLLGSWTDWQPERIAEVVGGRSTEYVAPPGEWPVHLVYFTAWPDASGAVGFFDDVYGHDEALAAALGL